MVKLIIAVPQRKPAFPSRNRACLAMKLWQHGLLSVFAGMTCDAGATIKAAKSNLTVNCNFLYGCQSGSTHPELGYGQMARITTPGNDALR
jgi:hypothetical protein